MSFRLRPGTTPLVISIPHLGTSIPEPLRQRYDPRALAVEDADWHLDRLYAFADDLGASVLQAEVSRYVIDLNRPPDDAPMYPGASNTELCPTRFFTGEPLYAEHGTPDSDERARRRTTYWQPYHDALAAEIARVKAVHGHALLWDAHSIRSEIPWLFEGVLPDLNIGTAAGASAHPSIADAVVRAAQDPAFSHVLNGRFKGGYITRHYGQPAQHVHAVQLEMCQKTYMSERPPYEYIESRAAAVQPVVRRMLTAAVDGCKALYGR
jgi:N-formylglutamate deformylase